MIAGALATGLAASALMPVKPAFAGDRLTIVTWGGAAQAAYRKAIFDPFTKTTGIKIIDDEWNGEIAKVRAMVEAKTVSWDVITTPTSSAVRMCNDGLIETIDWKKVGLDRDQFGDAGKFDCGLPQAYNGTVVAYDKNRLPNGPKTIADLFDTKVFPGKRGLWKNVSTKLEWALIADGVPRKEVYKVLRTPEGVDRAFRKLDTIKQHVIWWTSGAQPMQLLADRQVVMTEAWNTRVTDAVKQSGQPFEMMWDAAVGGWQYWVIPKGTPRLDDAYKYLGFAGTPQTEAALTRYLPLGPGNRDAMALVDPAVLPDLANSPEHYAVAMQPDPQFWLERGDELTQRFNAWLAK
ncbi:ABC transporter substrate-binding protein [Bradyrhizobium yuanmingense]|uniref:ABC transporter substrate-binding protein n=1 Tax=Bradyrhizobium yuanmingense TaxID=108015 RepID=UPI0023B8C1AE|nr:ABC transporter substrate-binding protein [Bradyrhizobium yuanmingense]MDF0523098.1 ABC transporter substrate-binding protein [Bradyrhizobium yuanmingense]